MTAPRALLRRTMLALVVLAYAVWMLRDDAWHTGWFFVRFSLFTLGEAATVIIFLETRLWRWSLAPAHAPDHRPRLRPEARRVAL